MTLTEQDVISQLNKLLSFLTPLLPLANSHFSSFFSENIWNKFVPATIQSELNNINSVKNFIDIYPDIIKNNSPNEFVENHPNLIKFLHTAMTISITRNQQYSNALKNLEKQNLANNCNGKDDIQMEDFMSQKKFHEVKITSKMTDFISNTTQSSHIVDIGGGKGYLSCILTLHYSFKVLGLDSSEVTTCGALKRSEKVAKMWTGELISHPKGGHHAQVNTKKAREQFIQNHYRQIITFVNPDTDIEELLRKSFNEDVTAVTLTGLHTCGDLASTCLKIFLSSIKVQGIINVGCCYNQIHEEFSNDTEQITEEKSQHFSFPMSRFLKGKKYSLGRNARMLAAHSLERYKKSAEFEFSQTSNFYRAVLETVSKKFDADGHVGRLAQKCNNFHEYMLMGLKKLGVDEQLSKEDSDKLYETFIDKKPFLTAFYLLRISLAPVVESIILLDRTLYLIENGINNVYLARLFDLEISPRGFGIIAWKDFEKC